MTSGVRDKRRSLSCQSNQQARYGDVKMMSRVHPTSYKGQLLIAFSSTNISTEINRGMG